jgi:acyl carrier protein phosphodiesterase
VNYLAHLHLADDTPESKVGNIFADIVKGPDVDLLPEDILAGVRLHRAVDSFTDSHPVVMRSIRRLGGRLGWYAGVVIDVYYDHLLARNWYHYSHESLRDFTIRAYQAIGDHLHLLNGEGRKLMQRLIREDRLYSYRTRQGISETLERISWRIMERMPKREVRLHDAMPLLLAADADLEDDFSTFYPHLMAFVESRKLGLAPPAALRMVESPA